MSDKPYSILFLSSWYPNRTYPTFGIFVKRHAVAAAIHNQVSVIYVSSDENNKELYETEKKNDSGIDTTLIYYKKILSNIPLISPLLKFIRQRKAYTNELKKLLATNKTDLIHLNVAFPTGLFALYIKRKYKIPFVLTEHWTGYLPEDNSYHGFFRKLITKRVIKNAACIMPVTKNLADHMQQHGLPGNYQVVPNVVENEIFKYNTTTKENNFSFLHVSTLDDSQKNVSGIIKTFALFVKKEPTGKLTIVGDGIDRPKLEQQANSLGLLNKNIFFTGKKDSKSLYELYNSHHALVLFSRYENFPSVIAEAMTCGMPIISSNVGGINEHFKNELGILVKSEDEVELLHAMEQVKQHYATYQSSTISSYAIANFGINAVSEKLQHIYKQAIHG